MEIENTVFIKGIARALCFCFCSGMQQLLVISPQLVERMCAQLWSSYTRSPLTEENTFTALSLSAARFHRKC